MHRPTLALIACLVGTVLLLAACAAPKAPATSERSTTAPQGGTPAQAATGQLRVGVPCGLVPAYEACKKLFLAEHPGITFKDDVRNIDPLTRAIRDGKVELDIYLGLGERETRSVVDKGLSRGEPTPFLKQSLRLAVPKGNPLGIHAIEDLADDKVRTVAICTDDLAIGQAAEKALRGTGVWDALESSKRLVRLPQPAQAKDLVFKGKADATFVFGACTDESWTTADPERATQGKAEVVVTVPDALYGGMHAQAVVLTAARDPELAESFVQFLLRPECQKAVVQWGYDPIESAESATP
jgi:molybdate transport system substrate-binding protein